MKTSNRAAAQRLIAAKNAAVEHPQLNLALARTYLSAHDPKMLARTWQEAMDQYALRGRDSTRDRSARAFKGTSFDRLRRRIIIETTADDFLLILNDCGASIAHYLRRLQNFALTTRSAFRHRDLRATVAAHSRMDSRRRCGAKRRPVRPAPRLRQAGRSSPAKTVPSSFSIRTEATESAARENNRCRKSAWQSGAD